MHIPAQAPASEPNAGTPDSTSPAPRDNLAVLVVGAIGVVFGDIGTSPLYAMKESFIGPHPLAVDRLHIFGVLSLIFWALMLIVTVKYVLVAMRADNKGEGGSFALLSLISSHLDERRKAILLALGVLAAALFYGDAMLTPAISVLSAVEGLTIIEQRLEPLVLPISVLILLGLFFIQSRGTARVGALFGPVILVYFVVLAALGLFNIAAHPEILSIFNPWWAVDFFRHDPRLGFLAMGSVFLAVTGAETLYADMGHFGRKAIGLSWLGLVFPCLMLNYMGQGALLLDNPAAVENPFYLMAPDWARLPLICLATCATIIASQAVISGAFSVTHQAIQLSFLPRFKILHTSAKAAGQIYIPTINWGLLLMVLILVLGFRKSTSLASAYGISVVGTMLITTAMLAFLIFKVWRWNPWAAGATIALFATVDIAFFLSNIAKIADGGWVPLTVAVAIFTVLTTWAKGRKMLREQLEVDTLPLQTFVNSTSGSIHRVKGTSIFLSAAKDGIPAALLHNIKHNQVLHENVVLLTVEVAESPRVNVQNRLEVHHVGQGFHRVIMHYGFTEEIDIPSDLTPLVKLGIPLDPMRTSYFLGRQKLIATREIAGMALWREHLFAWMLKASESAMDYYRLPANRVVELGSQIRI
ncbi:potassium transporter Kup [Novosphingobium sp.]|uniref:potassium transporter Kup n=1 Tax=Novosphingobium sp. TaxID=1874826 RepID=UPI0025E7BB82|nr:potassium transporter Kup [Novosphingobium sp.]MCC6926950.1 potassium transporter Kup [Novosphingobium sp.]